MATEKKTPPWWAFLVGISVSIGIAILSLASSWGSSGANLANITEDVKGANAKIAAVTETVQTHAVDIATTKTKVQSTEEAIKDIKETQKQILDILLKIRDKK
jgi:hypothetical protein